MLHNKVLAIVGPTASGKTALSVLLAEKLLGEIISADSRQIYRYLTIGTAKPSAIDLQRVRHHFIDILEPDQDYNVGDYGQQARTIITELMKQKKQPILVGGSGLYIRAVIDGLFEGPGKNSEIREQLEEEVQDFGAEALFRKLQAVDPVSAGKMDTTKVRRIIRALEVYFTTGKPISQIHSAQNTKPPFHVVQFGLEWNRQALYKRIELRVDEMFSNGLMEEIQSLRAKGFSPGINALNTVGYKEAFQYIEGKITKEKMVELVKRNTRRFAKRQLTWFRADKRIHWIPVNENTVWKEIADKIYLEFHSIEENG